MSDPRNNSEKHNKLEETEETFDSGYLTGEILSGEIPSGEIKSEPIERQSEGEGEEPKKEPTEESKATSENKSGKEIVQEVEVTFDSAYESGVIDSFAAMNINKENQQPEQQQQSQQLPQQLTEEQKWQVIQQQQQRFVQNLQNMTKQQRIDLYFTPNEDGDTYFHLCIIMPWPWTARQLMYAVPDLTYLDDRNHRCEGLLHLAVLTNQPDILRDLIIAGANPTVRLENGTTPLHLACQRGDYECAKQLLTPLHSGEQFYKRGTHQFPQDLEHWNYEGETCIHVAAMSGKTDIIKLLVEHGADINAKEGKAGRTILHRACEENNLKLVQFLLTECKGQIDLEAETYGRKTAFEITAYNAKYNPKFKRIKKELKKYGCVQYQVVEDSDLSDEEHECAKCTPGKPFYNNNTSPINVA